MTSILLVVHVMTAVVIVVLVLMQQGRGADMGAAFGGGSQTLFGARGSANFLSRITGLLAAVFFVTSLTLAYLFGQGNQPQSVTDQIVGAPVQTQSGDQAQGEAQSDGEETRTQTDIPAAPDVNAGQDTGQTSGGQNIGQDSGQAPVSDIPVAPEPASD